MQRRGALRSGKGRMYRRSGGQEQRTCRKGYGAARVAAVCFLVTALLCYGLFALERHIEPVMQRVVRYECARYATEVFNYGIDRALETNADAFEALYVPCYDAAGSIAAVQADSAKINQLEAVLSEHVTQRLQEQAGEVVSTIPVGMLLGWHLLAARGPQLTMRVWPEAYVKAEITDTLLETGLNQTSLKVNVHYTMYLSVVVLGYSAMLEEETDVLLNDVLLMGKVPQNYWVRGETALGN